MDLNHAFVKALQEEGCHIIGFADLRELPEECRNKLPVGIIMATTYAPEKLWDKLSEAQRKIINDDWASDSPLDCYNKKAKAFLKEHGYKRNTTYPTMQLTYKMLATIAGIGWIGRNTLLVSNAQGPAVRFTAVLTNAPFACGTPITASQCPPNCRLCMDACPGKAIKAEPLWARGIHRDEFFDVDACKKNRSGCGGACVACCPFTAKGLC
ncbi:MAG: hypothetical protein FWC71_06385 [Defluviitaleaceae bacterium]|nr:hypothetical protein [Defluviitaleaceae bacterium]